MKTATTTEWLADNQRHLMAEIGRVRLALERRSIPRPENGPPPDDTAQAAPPSDVGPMTDPPARLQTLCVSFGLSPFERDVLLLTAGPELDGRFHALIAEVHGDPRRTNPTFGLALASLSDAHWSALAPAAPLRHWRLVELGKGDALVNAPLTIDERVLHYLTGISDLDERLDGLVQRAVAPAELPPSQFAIARRIVDIWSDPVSSSSRPIIQLCDTRGADTISVAAMACAKLELQLHALRTPDIPTTVSERETLARLWDREALLCQSALLVESDESDDADLSNRLIPFLRSLHGLILVSCRDPLRDRYLPIVRLDVGKPTAAEQKTIWRTTLGRLGYALDGELDDVVSQFRLGVHAIESTCATLAHEDAGRDHGSLSALLWDTCRTQVRPRLDNLAQRIEPHASWDDLVLPKDSQQLLHEMVAHVRHRTRVYETWGFAAKGGIRGLGISGLFAGSSGTGKTLAAEIIANELRLDLYRIDLSQVVSKYIGETEKNLRRVFDAAEDGGAILLFDEADALFGKRSEVKDSHDRYANVEVSYLLQRMESYRGLAILTTNMRQALDPAFLRRIRFAVTFPFPDAAARAEIWRRIFPAATPTEGLEIQRLARLNVPGGNIRNIALQAAFAAANAGEPVRMAHLLHAARTECMKIEKPLTDAEIGGWI
ncbi:MAG: ATP-binding protein [Phycisphaerales bacterium]